MAPGDSNANHDALDRDERLVEFVRHFHGCEDLHIETGRLLFELATAVLDKDQIEAHRLAREGLRHISALPGDADVDEN